MRQDLQERWPFEGGRARRASSSRQWRAAQAAWSPTTSIGLMPRGWKGTPFRRTSTGTCARPCAR
eukprot:7440390-Alexandrium_andersonii.AAC.1